jgi:peptidoglycan hydrolase-like protein with peptidoglycan-binding domain
MVTSYQNLHLQQHRYTIASRIVGTYWTKRGINMKANHQVSSSKLEELARDMRIAALDGYKILTGPEVLELREELQKLYFNAGRWAAGDRDWVARQANFEFQKRMKD